jgi:diacylglycerol kinase family enzyme
MNSIDFSKLTIGAILNTASGSCDATSEEKMRTILTSAGILHPKMWCGHSADMPQAFAEAAISSLDVLIVLGGDGTIRSGAEACTSAGPFLIPLPGGTMNVLPKALYGEHSWEEVLTAVLQGARIKNVSGGCIEGQQFFITAILGAPALWANAREAMRDGDLGEAVDKGVIALQNMFANKIQYSFSSQDMGEAEAVTVTCPLISEELADTERAFEAAALDVKNAGELLGLASSAAFGKWLDDEHVTMVKTKNVRVSSEKEIPVIIDGESIECGSVVVVEFIPEAFKALVPTI